MSLVQRIKTLVARTIYEAKAPDPQGVSLSLIEKIRMAWGGAIAPPTHTELRWYLADVETASRLADQGDLSMAARMWRAACTYGAVRGTLSTRTDGLVRLPKIFKGPDQYVSDLQAGSDSVASVFDLMFPPAELALMASDGIGLGVAIGEMLPVKGRDYPVLCRLPPEHLRFRINENRWYYQSIGGLIPIDLESGRWVLHLPGGRIRPWEQGAWAAVCRAYIAATHAESFDNNFQSKLANSAVVANSPQGASETQAQSYFDAIVAWGTNTIISSLPGYKIELVESNGRGSEAFNRCIERSERQIAIILAGQTVTTDGGAGFVNAAVFKSIRADLIQATADSLALTINTQGIPVFLVLRYGEEALETPAIVAWDTKPAKDASSEASALVQVGAAVTALDNALSTHKLSVNVKAICERFNVPIQDGAVAIQDDTQPTSQPKKLEAVREAA